MSKTPLISFHNEFDDTDVEIHTASPDNAGPFTVTLKFNDPAIGTEENGQQHEFSTLREARVKFLELVGHEIDAVQGEIEN